MTRATSRRMPCSSPPSPATPRAQIVLREFDTRLPRGVYELRLEPTARAVCPSFAGRWKAYPPCSGASTVWRPHDQGKSAPAPRCRETALPDFWGNTTLRIAGVRAASPLADEQNSSTPSRALWRRALMLQSVITWTTEQPSEYRQPSSQRNDFVTPLGLPMQHIAQIRSGKSPHQGTTLKTKSDFTRVRLTRFLTARRV